MDSIFSNFFVKPEAPKPLI